jgi:hypothetical protein
MESVIFKNKVMKQVIAFIMLFSIVACKNINPKASVENTKKSTKKIWDVKKVDGKLLVFNDNSSINTRLYAMSYIESLTDSSGSTYFVLSGRICSECDENISIFLISPKDTIKPLSELPSYMYPGKVYYYLNKELIFESKLFIGNCINIGEKTNKLIWVQRELNDNNKFDSLMFIVDIFNDKIRNREIKPQTQEYKSNLQHLKNCREIKGVETTSEP